MKKLEDMTKEELWQLFPIFLVRHKPVWLSWFEDEKALLADLLKDIKWNRIEHIGSTFIPDIYAKNIVDILIEVHEHDYFKVIHTLENKDYIKMNQNPSRAAFNKGYSPEGFLEKVFHIHIRKPKDIDELYFRDYLIDHHLTAKAYETLKLNLWHQYEHNRDAYTQAKTDFIVNITAIAKTIYKNRYI